MTWTGRGSLLCGRILIIQLVVVVELANLAGNLFETRIWLR
jgi:hypothetical protein